MLTGYDIIFTTVTLLLFDVVFHAELRVLSRSKTMAIIAPARSDDW